MIAQIIDHLKNGRADEAERACLHCCSSGGGDAEVWFLLGAARDMQGRGAQALLAFDRALQLDARHARALAAKATLLFKLGNNDEALQTCRRALTLRPDDAEVLANMAAVLEVQNDAAGALQHYERALKARPGMARALLNRGVLLARLGRYQDALANNDELARLFPQWDEAHFNRAEVLLALGRYDAALAASEHVLQLNRAHLKAQIDRALALSALGRLEEAQAAFDAAQAADPVQFQAFRNALARESADARRKFDARLIYLHLAYARQENWQWGDRGLYLQTFERLLGERHRAGADLDDKALIFASLAMPLSVEARLRLARSVSRRVAATVTALADAPLRTSVEPGPIRLGYISPNFRRHPNAHLTRALYRLHDRSRFEVFAYSLQPDDGSAMSDEIRRGCDHFIEVSDWSDRAVAQRIRADGIDVLVDLAGYFEFGRPEILAMRPAPVQVRYLGMPGTSGADFIDYFISDTLASPPTQEHYWSERLVYLPHTYFIYGDGQAIEHPAPARADLGLPAGAFVFCCFNNHYKIEPKVFTLWMTMLRRVPGSVLWLLANNAVAEQNLRGEAAARGVDPGRIVFAPYIAEPERHLPRYRAADLFVDTLDYNAHTTACDALWAGLPLLTCLGTTFPARVSASLLDALGMSELVAATPAQYLERAVQLATSRAALTSVNGKLARNRLSQPLFDTAGRARELEAAFASMVQRERAGLPPQSFRVALATQVAIPPEPLARRHAAGAGDE